jgi:hypothetical protein
VLGQARLATPRLGFGRIIADGLIASRYENYLNRRFELGGDTRLRGYPAAGFGNSRRGPLAVALNLELRTRSVDILSVQTGLAAFYDAGDATQRFADVRLRQSAGIGFRCLFPEFDRMVMRVDWAFPFTPVPGTATFPGAVYVTFDQAFSMPGLNVPSPARPDTR